MKTDWIRATRQRLCHICGRDNWCSVAADGSVAICMRNESDKPTRNGGWLHRLTDDCKPPARRTVKRKAKTEPIDFSAIHQRHRQSLRPESLGWLSNELGIGVEVVERFTIGWHAGWNVYSIPMRRPNGSVCGLKYRNVDGRKFCEAGSKSGLFFVPGSLLRDSLIIVEGCTDAMAIHQLGFCSVIGRDNCTGNVEQITTLCRRLKPKRIAIVPDNDHHGAGLRGAEALKQILAITHSVEIVELPNGINDVRDCIQTKKNADGLLERISEIIQTKETR